MLLDVPVDPDRDTAQEWARDELAKQEYQTGTGTNWLARFMEWVQNLIESLGNGLGGAWGGWGLVGAIVLIAAVVGLIVWLVVGPLRRSRGHAIEDEALGDPTLTADDLAARATAAARDERWDVAVIEAYRSVIRTVEEREAIATRAGMTALEASVAAGIALPSIAEALAVDSDVFDSVRYGHLDATAAHYAHVVATRSAAATARIEVLV